MAELNLSKCLKYVAKDKKYTEIVKYPKVTRDLSIVVKNEVIYEDIKKIITKNAGNILEEVSLFDIYIFEKELEEMKDKKSVSVSLVFRNAKKTLEENEINEVMDKILKALEKELGAIRR